MQGTAEPETIPLGNNVPTEGSNSAGAIKPGPKATPDNDEVNSMIQIISISRKKK